MLVSEECIYSHQPPLPYRRLAMIAIGGMVAGAAVTGNGFPYLP
jgi:hypothetical protein